MKFHITRQVLLVVVTLASYGAAKENLRGGGAEEILDSMQGEGEVNRFLNVFEDEGVEKTDGGGGRFMIKYKSHDGMMRSQSKRGSRMPSIMTMTKLSMQVVNLSSSEEVKEYEEDDDVLYIAPDPKRYLVDSIAHRRLEDVGDEEIPYGIDMVKALDVPDDLVANRKVCIIDTGYDITHPDLPDEPIVTGDNNRGNKWDTDGNGHGTHVAGTIAAIGDNGQGVVGVNRSGLVGLHIIRIFGDNGRPIFGSTLMGAAQKCVDAGSNIISMSLGGPIGNPIERDFFQTVYEELNVLVVAAAGNSGNNRYSYPASYDAVMSVAAIDENKDVAFFSQKNDQVEISAPGVRVLSTQAGGGYIAYSGTSMACPHVAGVAALVWSHATGLSSIQIRSVLRETAEDLGTNGLDNTYGYGLVRADSAYDMVSNGDFTFSPTASPTPEGECFDFPDYENSRGDGCDWYEGGFFINRCSFFGNGRPDSDGVTGNDACCVCGGGTIVYPTTPTSSPTASPTGPTTSPTASPTECVDLEGYENSRGRDCDWFMTWGWRCNLWGNSFPNEDGVVANDACCACKD